MSRGENRNAALSRSALVVVAGATLIGVTQRTPDIAQNDSFSLAGLIGGVAVVVVGLVLALRSFFGRSGGADQ